MHIVKVSTYTEAGIEEAIHHRLEMFLSAWDLLRHNVCHEDAFITARNTQKRWFGRFSHLNLRLFAYLFHSLQNTLSLSLSLSLSRSLSLSLSLSLSFSLSGW